MSDQGPALLALIADDPGSAMNLHDRRASGAWLLGHRYVHEDQLGTVRKGERQSELGFGPA